MTERTGPRPRGPQRRRARVRAAIRLAGLGALALLAVGAWAQEGAPRGGAEPWVDAPTTGPAPPRGGAFGYAGIVADVPLDAYVLHVTGFDPWFDTVVIGGQPLAGHALPLGIAAWDYRGSAVIAFGESGAVVLRGVTVDEWRTGAIRQLHGTPGPDRLEGTPWTDVIAGGGGPDTVSAGAGDDRIVYSSGDDRIRGGEEGRGFDRLDLRRFALEEIRLVAAARDLLVVTPSGTIRLEGQLAGAAAGSDVPVDEVLLDGDVLDAAALRARAEPTKSIAGGAAPQAPASASPRTWRGGPGDDGLGASDGPDTFVFERGDGTDVVRGFDPEGGDVLVFLDLLPGDVAVVSVGGVTAVAYPGGLVRLEGLAGPHLPEGAIEVRPPDAMLQ